MLGPVKWLGAQPTCSGLPVTLHVRTCRIFRMVRTFDPSGLEVNPAESDSAVRYRHGEFESSHGQASSLLLCRGTVDRGEQILTGPRELVHERESFIGGYLWQLSGPEIGGLGCAV